MDAGLAALLGASVATVGTIAAAILGSRSASRQARSVSSDQRELEHRRRRRDTYGEFLRACSDAREELSTIWHLIRQAPDDGAVVRERLTDARKLIYAVQRANDSVLMEGPASILAIARNTQESLEVFYVGLLTLWTELTDGGSWVESSRLCAAQRMRLKQAIERFSEQAGMSISGEWTPSRSVALIMTDASLEDLSWLVENLSRLLDVPKKMLTLDSSAMELGLDSVMAVQLCRAGHHRYGLEVAQIWPWMIRPIGEFATHLTRQRRVKQISCGEPQYLFPPL